jgi:hypothetical protein
MKKSRIGERKKAIAEGLISDPDTPTRLEDTIDFKGTCEKCVLISRWFNARFKRIVLKNAMHLLETEPEPSEKTVYVKTSETQK